MLPAVTESGADFVTLRSAFSAGGGRSVTSTVLLALAVQPLMFTTTTRVIGVVVPALKEIEGPLAGPSMVPPSIVQL